MKLFIVLAVVCGVMALTPAIGPASAQQAPPPPQHVTPQPPQQPDQQVKPAPPQQPDQQVKPAAPQQPASPPGQQSESGSPNQWLSHQMNQPPPPPQSERQKISQDRIDELQQLYELAKKEQEAKTKKQGPVKW